jgi:flagellar hook assembly protein FlgD
LKSRLANIEQALSPGKQISSPVTLTDASLEQNAPNPFNQSTVINYYLPQKTRSAVMNITDINGKIIKTVALTEKGKGQVRLEAGLLTAGTYQYSLIINEKLVDTKKMVLTK